MSNLIPFHFESQSVQVIVGEDGELSFIAKEVASILGYSDAYEMTKRLDDEEKSNRQIAGLGTQSGGRGVTVINESGLYSAILGSNKPEAKPFKRWVTSEVLPAIRKTGSYKAGQRQSTPKPKELPATKVFSDYFKVSRLIGLDKNAAAIAANQATIQIAGTNVLRLIGHTQIEAENQQTQYFNPTELGKPIGFSAKNMNLLLLEAGMQVKRGDSWEVTNAGRAFVKLYDTSKKHDSGVPVMQIKWSPSVIQAIRNFKEAA